MDLYIDKNNVLNSVNHFKDVSITNDSMLFAYLITKHLGITNQSSVTFLSKHLTEEQVNHILYTIWKFGGLVDPDESFNKHTVMFPNGFEKLDFYQKGSNFKQLVGRLKDTIEKKNTNIGLFNNNEGFLTLNRDTQRIISDEYLNGLKISLSNLATWIFRFDKLEFDVEPTPTEFNRVLRRMVLEYLKINVRDFTWLFDDDFDTNLVSFSDSRITGYLIRNHLGINDLVSNENDGELSGDDISLGINQNPTISNEIINEYSELKGDNPSIIEIKKLLSETKQIILTGVPGTGKTRLTKQLSSEFEESTIVQFHANTSYGEFIGGETLDTASDGSTKVVTRKGKFLEAIEQAKSIYPQKLLFIIDEINRGDISGIFGETIITLDREYSVDLMYPIEDVKTFSIPKNLYIIGTMNSSDRNIAFLDLALRRRFSFIEITPNYDYLTEKITLEVNNNGMVKKYNLGAILKHINKRIRETLNDREKILGQSYFIPNDADIWEPDSFKRQFNFNVLPTLNEYSHQKSNAVSSILGENLSSSINDTESFFRAFDDTYSDFVL